MSYQVLARKWRPRSFKELVGQTHVLQALVNALHQDRLHHAYLFTGTRGVGKTTIARILAKCLNCETGISSTPCGECSACREIDSGRFVDLIEVDAASRTKVEDTRELLDNVQYAPTRGRFKVYLIDEVHMLSTHSFNALLKTLEEPPPHVKFLLATTDPQKLPVTILSRCLQFGLKNMTPERIVGHLKHVLDQESIPFESAALWQLARGADGSMRDALSLTDQAIAFGNGQVNEQEVSVMLGTIDQGQVMKMVVSLSTGNAADVLKAVSELSEHAPDYAAVLDDMLSMLHRIAIAQAVPDVVDNSQGDREQVLALAANMLAEDVQLYYQVGLIGKRDLPLAPDPRGGFEMAMLRMLAFRPKPVAIADAAGQVREPASAPAASAEQQVGSSESEPEPAVTHRQSPGQEQSLVHSQEETSPSETGHLAANVLRAMVASEPSEPTEVVEEPAQEKTSVTGLSEQPSDFFVSSEPSAPVRHENPLPEDFSPSPMPGVAVTDILVPEVIVAEPVQKPPVEPPQAGDPTGFNELPPIQAYDHEGHQDQDEAPPPVSAYEAYAAQIQAENTPANVEATPEAVHQEPEPIPDLSERVSLVDLNARSWVPVFRSLPLNGVTRSIASHCEYVSHSAGRIQLRLDEQRNTLYNETHRSRVEKALSEYFDQPLKLTVESGVIETETPAAWRERKIAERLQEARDSIYNDANIKALVNQFSATVLEESIQPVGNVIK